jgi:hypothetical protein
LLVSFLTQFIKTIFCSFCHLGPVLGVELTRIRITLTNIDIEILYLSLHLLINIGIRHVYVVAVNNLCSFIFIMLDWRDRLILLLRLYVTERELTVGLLVKALFILFNWRFVLIVAYTTLLLLEVQLLLLAADRWPLKTALASGKPELCRRLPSLDSLAGAVSVRCFILFADSSSSGRSSPGEFTCCLWGFCGLLTVLTVGWFHQDN